MPTAVEFVGNLGAVVVTLPTLPAIPVVATPTIGGRSSQAHGLLLPAVHTGHATNLLPAGQNVHQALIGLLQPAVPGVVNGLQRLSTGGHATYEAIAVGSTGDALGVLIGLLHTQGVQVKEAFGGGSTSGYAGPSVVFRKLGGAPAGVFVRQVGLARSGAM